MSLLVVSNLFSHGATNRTKLIEAELHATLLAACERRPWSRVRHRGSCCSAAFVKKRDGQLPLDSPDNFICLQSHSHSRQKSNITTGMRRRTGMPNSLLTSGVIYTLYTTTSDAIIQCSFYKPRIVKQIAILPIPYLPSPASDPS